MSKFKLDPFFPDKNLNPQGWVTDFITSRLNRTGEQRSDLANLIYDESLTDETVANFNLQQQRDEINAVRKRNPKDKSIFLNPSCYDAVERNISISSKPVENTKDMRDYYQYMINVKTNELSSFVPYVRMKFGYKKAKEKTFTEVEVPFVQNLKTEVASILADKFSRGQGAGIESVSAARSFPGLGLTLNVEVTVNYFFSSISTITKQITNNYIPKELNFTYSKLLSFLPSTKQKLVLEYGYGINPSDSNVKYSKIGDIIQAETKRIPLAYKSHQLNIEENGTVKVSVKYLAYTEAQLFQKNDVTTPGLDFVKKISNNSIRSLYENYNILSDEYYRIQRQLLDLRENTVELQSIGGSKQKLDSLLKQKQILSKRSANLSKQITVVKQELSPYIKDIIIEAIIQRRQMFSISFSSERKGDIFEISHYLNLVKRNNSKNNLEFISIGNENGYKTTKNINEFNNFDISVLEDNTVGLQKEDLFRRIVTNLFDGVERGVQGKKFGYITFFPLKALISILYEFLPDEQSDQTQYEIPFTCFGNVTARSFGKEYSVNIGDVLIELQTFTKWLYKHYNQKTRIEYSLSDFLKDMVEELVPQAISRNNTGFYNKNSIGSIRHMLYYTKLNLNNTTDLKLINDVYKQPYDSNNLSAIFSSEKNKDSKGLIYFSQMLNPLNNYTSPYFRKYIAKEAANANSFNFVKDSEIGIPHVQIGADRGLIKKVGFSAIEQPFLASSLVKQAMADGDTRLPRYAYNINVDMFGNNLFNQAGFIAVPPFGVEGGVDVDLGLTGYYIVTKINDNISVDGGYSTSVTAIWHGNPLVNKKEKATLEDSADNTEIKENIVFTVEDYIKDLLDLDPSTLKSLGITSQPITKEKKSDAAIQEENKEKPKRDRVENVGVKK